MSTAPTPAQPSSVIYNRSTDPVRQPASEPPPLKKTVRYRPYPTTRPPAVILLSPDESNNKEALIAQGRRLVRAGSVDFLEAAVDAQILLGP